MDSLEDIWDLEGKDYGARKTGCCGKVNSTSTIFSGGFGETGHDVNKCSESLISTTTTAERLTTVLLVFASECSENSFLLKPCNLTHQKHSCLLNPFRCCRN